MSINLIAACDLSRGIGYHNELLVKLPNDLKRFKELTTNGFVCMGRKTYESIGHALPQRTNIILSRDTKYQAPVGTFVYHNIDSVIHEYKNYGNGEVDLWIIGGSEIYKQFLPHADKIYLTIIDHKFPNADAWFPQFDISNWKVTENIPNKADEKHLYNYHFVSYNKR